MLEYQGQVGEKVIPLFITAAVKILETDVQMILSYLLTNLVVLKNQQMQL